MKRLYVYLLSLVFVVSIVSVSYAEWLQKYKDDYGRVTGVEYVSNRHYILHLTTHTEYVQFRDDLPARSCAVGVDAYGTNYRYTMWEVGLAVVNEDNHRTINLDFSSAGYVKFKIAYNHDRKLKLK